MSAPVPIRLFRDVQRSAVKLDRVPESQAIVFDVRNFKDPAAGNLKHHDGRHDEIIDRIRCLPQASGKYVQGGCWLPGASCEAAQRLPELGGQPAHPDCPGVAAFRPLDRAELCQASENFGNSGQFKAWLHVSFQPFSLRIDLHQGCVLLQVWTPPLRGLWNHVQVHPPLRGVPKLAEKSTLLLEAGSLNAGLKC